MTTMDINLYDRQIRTYGEEALKKITSSAVTIIGLENGLATEIAKNLALGGIKQIFLYDSSPITIENLETGFYYSKEDLGNVRSDTLVKKIQELNPYVIVSAIHSEDEMQINSIFIIVNQTPDKIKYYENKFKCRLVAVSSKGIAGMVFVNAGEKHIITDTTGETISPVQIGSIDKLGNVICAPNQVHEFQTGDYVKFENLEGEAIEKLINVEFKITSINPVCFKIDGDFLNIKIINGTAILIKKPITVSHQLYSVQYENPSFNFSFDDSDTIFKTLNNIKCDSELSKKIAETFICELMPVFSLIGSIAASETIKLITNKYVPINQFWCWYDPCLLPISKPITVNQSGISKLYGSDFEEALAKSSWFIVGSGAIGCELLKNLAYCNVSTQGNIYITDPDHIEKSNLNRQFLFRTEHIGKPKSIVAAEVIKQFRKEINITALTEKVSNDNQAVTDKIMKKVTGVFNALDNIQARRYMDEQCFNKGLPLFESGTTGTKGNTQPVIPFLTETYSNSADPPQEKSFPICTIKNFPNEIHHTIHWAMDYFELFNRAPYNINRWIKDETIYKSMSVENTQGKEDVLNFLVKLNISDFDSCIQSAVNMFYDNFKHQLVQLLTTYPVDHKTAEGQLFWSNGKRAPKPIEKLDVNNSNHMDYIEATTNLIAKVYKLDNVFDRDYIKQVAFDYEYIDNFKVNTNLIIPVKDSDIQKSLSSTDELPSNKKYQHIVLESEVFEKDDPTNWHISFINAASNLRAINYGIPTVSYHETKGIAGKIIPAIATTTSAVSGLIVLEMLKYMLKYMLSRNDAKIENYRSTFINLADTTLVYSEPLKAGSIKIGDTLFNNWTKFEIKKDSILKEFRQTLEIMFKTPISMIVYDNGIIFADFMTSKEEDETLMSQLILAKTPDILFDTPVILTIATNDEEIVLPEIQFSL